MDETGDLKKGRCTAGVARQYTGTAGRVENAQVAVYPTYAAPAGHTLIDRELYLPRCWAEDPVRRRAAGIPAHVRFATKPALARPMIARALDAGTPARWATGDEVYGADPGLRAELEKRHPGYVLAVARNHRLPTAAAVWRADALAARLPARAWQKISAGAGSHGHRYYDWAWITISTARPGRCWLLVRRNRRTRELAYYRCYAPGHVPLAVLVQVAGIRWSTEENFQAGKGLADLDEHQVRTWRSWYRWVTLSMLALAFLTIAALTEHAQPPPAGLIPLTRNEIAHLTALTLQPGHPIGHRLHWSTWRGRRQHGARTSQYQRQAARDP